MKQSYLNSSRPSFNRHGDYLSEPKLTNTELLAIFPELSDIIPKKLHELETLRQVTVSAIETQLEAINAATPDDMSRWFWRQWLKLTIGEELLKINKDITRLNRQLRIAQGLPTPKGMLTDDLIQAAREVPIESILEQQFRRGGKTMVGLCPFHQERSPSFHIYTKENRGWCFGCNQGGDVIAIVMRLNDCGFKQAVELLVGGCHE